MPFYSDETLDEVRRGNEIVEVLSSYVQLRQRSGRHWGLCPFHREKSPSFTVSADMQTFYCFGCGTGGNVFTFIMKYENLGFVDSVKLLADRARIELPEEKRSDGGLSKLKEQIYNANAIAARFFYNCLKGGGGSRARDYLLHRRIKNSIVAKFGLGYAPEGRDSLYRHLKEQGFEDNVLERGGLVSNSDKGKADRFRGRLMFPIIDAGGRVLGFGGRNFDDFGPKYLNSPETPVFSKNRSLYGLNFARKAKTEETVIVEGYMDVLALFQAGFEGAMATLGTAMGVEHARVLNQYFRGKTAVLLFDSDSAGTAAALRAIPILRRENAKIKVLNLTEAKDPDEFLVKFGAEAFAAALKKAKHPTDYQLDYYRNQTKDDDNSTVAFVNAAVPVLAGIPDPVELDSYINAISAETGIRAETIRGQVDNSAGRPEEVQIPVLLPKKAFVGAVKTDFTEKLMYAYRTVLYWMASRLRFYEAVKDVLTEEEILYPAYRTLFSVIIKKNGNASPAELITYFTELSEQQDISLVFEGAMPASDDKDIVKDLNQQIREIKSNALLEKIKAVIANGELELLETLKNQQKTLPDSYIS